MSASAGTILEKPQPKTQEKESTSPPETKPSYFVDLATPIRDARDAYIEGMRTTLEKAIEVGRLLTEAKGKVKHGDWTVFVEEYCKFKMSSAQNYMRCYREREYLAKTHSDGFLERANLSAAIAWLEQRNGDDKPDDHDNDTDDDTKDDDHKADGDKDETDKGLIRKAKRLMRATSVVLKQIKGLAKEHGEDIWTRDELKDAVGHLTTLEEKLAEITDFAGIVDAE